MPPYEPPVVYTPAPVPSVELLLMIGKMDGKLDVLVAANAHMENRVTKIEAWQNKSIGVILGASLLMGAAGSQLNHIASFLAPVAGAH